MSVRAVLLGLLGASLICGFTYFNDEVIRQTFLVGSGMPPAVYGGVILMVLLVNPALRRLRKGWELSGAELAVVMALTLAACCIPSAGLLETFPNTVMMPHHIAKTDPAWAAERIVEKAPRCMLADVSRDEDRAVSGFVQGLSTGGTSISLGEVPWSAWTGTLLFWLPLMLFIWTALIAVSLIVHRQWADHERLPYPIATFAAELLPGDAARPPVYTNRLFLAGCGAVCFIHLCNYLYAWWPGSLVQLPLRFSFRSLGELFPTLERAGGLRVLHVDVYFTIIGLAYFLPKDVSFSMGIGPLAYYYLAGILAGYGISMSQGELSGASLTASLNVGAYAGMVALIVYAGRRYYESVFRSALGLRTADAVEPQVTWSARVFLVCMLAVVAMLTAVGLDLSLALVFTVVLIASFVVVGRISAEAGHIFIQLYAPPVVLIMGTLGVGAIGPSTALILLLLATVTILDTREAITPFVINAFKVLDRRQVKLGRAGGFAVLALVVGLAVAVPATLYIAYDRGTNLWYGWASQSVPRSSFDKTVRLTQRLRAQGQLEEAEARTGLGRLGALSPSPTFLAGFAAALCAFLLLSAARLRMPSWPIHPVMLLGWNTFGVWKFSSSFLLGALVKWLVVKYGGDKAFQRLKPVFIGLIAADMLTGVTTSIIGFVYYSVTSTPPPRFVILVG